MSFFDFVSGVIFCLSQIGLSGCWLWAAEDAPIQRLMAICESSGSELQHNSDLTIQFFYSVGNARDRHPC
jgi:hypothetical protein